MTSLEKLGYELLNELGISYLTQFVYGHYVADAFVETQNLIIQFDGDYWHANPNKFHKLSKRQIAQKDVDKRADGTAKSLGYRVIRFWESEVKHNPNAVKQRLLSLTEGL